MSLLAVKVRQALGSYSHPICHELLSNSKIVCFLTLPQGSGQVWCRCDRRLAARKRRSTMSEKKIVLITGASSGVGQETARLLAQAGHVVFGTSRNPSKQEQPSDIQMVPLDIRSDESVRT